MPYDKAFLDYLKGKPTKKTMLSEVARTLAARRLAWNAKTSESGVFFTHRKKQAAYDNIKQLGDFLAAMPESKLIELYHLRWLQSQIEGDQKELF